MVRIRTVAGTAAAYYLADLAPELGAAGGPGATGSWAGRGAAGLGLNGSVQPAPFSAVLAGCHPYTGRALRTRPGTVGGLDLTFTAPKSVSVLFALGTPDVAAGVVAAHRAAVEAAIGYVDLHALGVRRRAGDELHLLPTGGPIAATFTHGVSRTLDPHLHTHVVVANLAQGVDGRWSALDGRGLFAHRAAAGALYEAHLRHGLSTSLGVDWAQRRDGRREIAGLGPAVLGRFATRSAEIRAHLAGLGPPGGGRTHSGRARRIAWAVTRDPKAQGVAHADLTARWAAVAREEGVGPAELEAVLGRTLAPVTVVDEYRFAAALVTSTGAGATRRDVAAAWAGALARGGPVGDVQRSTDWVLAPAGRRQADPAAVGVREPAVGLAEVVPPGYLLTVLGPRPVEGGLQTAWRDAAITIDRYRRRWGVRDRADPLGAATPLNRLPVRRLADHLRTAQRVEEIRRRLGRDAGAMLERPDLSLGRG